MIKINASLENFNFAEAIIGTLSLENGCLLVEAENLMLDISINSENYTLEKGAFYGPVRMVFKEAKDITSSYDKSRLIPSENRICIGGSVFNQQKWFEIWFSFLSYEVYTFDKVETLNKSDIYCGVKIDHY